MTVEKLPVVRADDTRNISHAGGAQLVERRERGAALSSLPPHAIPPNDLHPVEVYIASLSAGSKRTMRAALEKIARIASSEEANAHNFPWHELRYQHTTAIRSILSEKREDKKGYAPATANKMLSALRGVLKECWRLGYISVEERERASDIAPVRGSTIPKGREVPAGERKALFDAFASDEKPIRGARDAAIVALLYVCGLRRSEAIGIDLKDFDPESGRIEVHSAKGNQERLVYATGGAAEAIRVWIGDYRGHEPGPLLCAVLKNEKVVVRRLSQQTVYDVLKRRGEEISVTKRFSPHDFRRTFVSDVIEAKDLSTAQSLAGHASPETTARYDRRGERAKREAAEELHIPYKAPRKAPQEADVPQKATQKEVLRTPS